MSSSIEMLKEADIFDYNSCPKVIIFVPKDLFLQKLAVRSFPADSDIAVIIKS